MTKPYNVSTPEEKHLYNLFHNIALLVKRNAIDKIDLYMEKVYDNDVDSMYINDDGARLFEFSKTLMVKLYGIWYRCTTTIYVELYLCTEEASWDSPGDDWEEIHAYINISKIVVDKTKEVIYERKKINKNFNTILSIQTNYKI